MLFLLAGHFLSFSHFLQFLQDYNGVNEKHTDQGGSFALLRRVGSFIDEQLVRPDDVGRCSTSTVSDIPEQGGRPI